MDLIATWWPLLAALAVLVCRALRFERYDCGVPGCRQPHNPMHRHDGHRVRRYSL